MSQAGELDELMKYVRVQGLTGVRPERVSGVKERVMKKNKILSLL